MQTGHPFCSQAKGKLCLRSCGRAKRTTNTKLLLQCTPSEIVHFIQIYTQKTGRQTFLISCNTYNEEGTASITKGVSSLSQTDPTSQKVERSIGTALIKHRNVSGVARIDQKSNIHKVMCNSRFCSKISECTDMRNLYALCFTTNYKPYFHVVEGGRTRRMSI